MRNVLIYIIALNLWFYPHIAIGSCLGDVLVKIREGIYNRTGGWNKPYDFSEEELAEIHRVWLDQSLTPEERHYQVFSLMVLQQYNKCGRGKRKKFDEVLDPVFEKIKKGKPDVANFYFHDLKIVGLTHPRMGEFHHLGFAVHEVVGHLIDLNKHPIREFFFNI